MNPVPTAPASLVPNISLDHPGWLTQAHGRVHRVFRVDRTLWTAICGSDDITFEPANENHTTATAPIVDKFDPSTLPPYFRTTVPFRDNTCVQRVRNPDLLDALLFPLFRQRRGVADATLLYRQFCAEHGTVIVTKAGPALLAPTADTVADLPEAAFTRLRIPDKQRPLQTAARAYLARVSDWDSLTPDRLLTELRTISGVNAWTAGAVVADITNDYSFYLLPVDVAYRQWTTFLAPPTAELSPREFAQLWETLSSAHRSTLNLLLLAARHRQPKTAPRKA